jgi:hypothetical protein
LITPGVLTVATISVTTVVLFLAAFVVGARLLRLRRQRSAAAALTPHRMALLAVGAGEDQDGLGLEHLMGADQAFWCTLRPAVVALLTKVRGEPAQQLVAVLRHHGDIRGAVGDLRSRSEIGRARAAHVLGLVRDPDHVSDLCPLLSDRSAEVRLVAVQALGAIGDPRAADAVLAALGPVRGNVGVPAYVVAEALVSMGSGTTETVLHGLHKADPVVRTVAAMVAGHITLVRASRSLRELLEHDPDIDVRQAASVALGLVGGPEDVDSLSQYLGAQTTAPLRRTCAAALGDVGDPLAAGVLAELLPDPDRRLAEIAAKSLIRLGPPGVERLEEALPTTPAGRVARAALAANRLPDLIEAPT